MASLCVSGRSLHFTTAQASVASPVLMHPQRLVNRIPCACNGFSALIHGTRMWIREKADNKEELELDLLLTECWAPCFCSKVLHYKPYFPSQALRIPGWQRMVNSAFGQRADLSHKSYWSIWISVISVVFAQIQWRGVMVVSASCVGRGHTDAIPTWSHIACCCCNRECFHAPVQRQTRLGFVPCVNGIGYIAPHCTLL